MAMAGAERIFKLLDEEVEVDDGTVTLVNARENEDGSLAEVKETTNMWAWKYPSKNGEILYEKRINYFRLYH